MIVLTGANGFIGREVLGLLTQAGHPVLTLTRQPLVFSGPADNVRALVAEDGDFSPLLPSEPFTLVHCAWCKPVRTVWTPHAAQVMQLSRALEAGGDRLQRVVALGSAEEYGPRSGCLDETLPVAKPLSPYGWGKRAAESLMESWSEKTGRPSVWMRPFTVYGEGQSGDMALAYALRTLQHGEVARFSDGRQRRDFIHVADVAAGIVRSVEATMQGHRVFNLGTGVATPLAEVLLRLAQHFAAESRVILGALPRRPGEPDEQFAATADARQALGWQAKISLEVGLRRLYESRTT